MSASNLPEVYEVMRRIERCKSKPNQMYMKAEFEFCARGIECAGQLTSTDRSRHTQPYGPTGKDVFTTEISHPPIPAEEVVDLILKVCRLCGEKDLPGGCQNDCWFADLEKALSLGNSLTKSEGKQE